MSSQHKTLAAAERVSKTEPGTIVIERPHRLLPYAVVPDPDDPYAPDPMWPEVGQVWRNRDRPELTATVDSFDLYTAGFHLEDRTIPFRTRASMPSNGFRRAFIYSQEDQP